MPRAPARTASDRSSRVKRASPGPEDIRGPSERRFVEVTNVRGGHAPLHGTIAGRATASLASADGLARWRRDPPARRDNDRESRSKTPPAKWSKEPVLDASQSHAASRRQQDHARAPPALGAIAAAESEVSIDASI